MLLLREEVAEDEVRLHRDLVLGVRLGQPRFVAVEKVEDGLFHQVARRVLLFPIADAGQFLAQSRVEVDCNLLDSFDVCRGQFLLFEQIEQGKRRLIETLPERTLLLNVEAWRRTSAAPRRSSQSSRGPFPDCSRRPDSRSAAGSRCAMGSVRASGQGVSRWRP